MLRRLVLALGHACAFFADSGAPWPNRHVRRGGGPMLDRSLD